LKRIVAVLDEEDVLSVSAVSHIIEPFVKAVIEAHEREKKTMPKKK